EHEKKYGTIQQLKETNDKLKQIKSKIIPIEKPKRQQQQQQQKPPNKNNKKQIDKGKQKEIKQKPAKISENKMDTS
ncbi:unnamed protein product, partial [Rotaria magnacalcarata]